MLNINVNRRNFLKFLIGGGSGVLSGIPQIASATGVNSWHRLTQTDRNRFIVDTAYHDREQYVGKECKEWVRDVISYASKKHVVIPSTAPVPNDWYWESDPFNHAIGVSMRLEDVPVGNIIQMRLKNGTPHTAIVAGKARNGVSFLESNRFKDKVVHLQPITYKQFYDGLGPARLFSAYYIL